MNFVPNDPVRRHYHFPFLFDRERFLLASAGLARSIRKPRFWCLRLIPRLALLDGCSRIARKVRIESHRIPQKTAYLPSILKSTQNLSWIYVTTTEATIRPHVRIYLRKCVRARRASQRSQPESSDPNRLLILPCCFSTRGGLIRSIPPMYGRNGSGIKTEPSGCK
jgi:hypothetical protein